MLDGFVGKVSNYISWIVICSQILTIPGTGTLCILIEADPRAGSLQREEAPRLHKDIAKMPDMPLFIKYQPVPRARYRVTFCFV